MFSVPPCANAYWDFGDGSTGTRCSGTTHCYTVAGNYTPSLHITDINGCTASVTHPGFIIVSTCAGIQNYAVPEMEVAIAPNPFVATMHLTIGHLPSIGSAMIYDLCGRLVFNSLLTSTDMQMDLTLLPRGIYLMKVNAENEQLTKKIVKL